MGLNEILARLQQPETLVEPGEMAMLSQYLSGFITDFELEKDELLLQQSFKWEELKFMPPVGEKPLTDKHTDIMLMRDPLTIRLNEVKRTLGELKRYRQDLNRRLEVIMQKNRYR